MGVHQPFHCAAPTASAFTSLVNWLCRNSAASSPETRIRALEGERSQTRGRAEVTGRTWRRGWRHSSIAAGGRRTTLPGVWSSRRGLRGGSRPGSSPSAWLRSPPCWLRTLPPVAQALGSSCWAESACERSVSTRGTRDAGPCGDSPSTSPAASTWRSRAASLRSGRVAPGSFVAPWLDRPALEARRGLAHARDRPAPGHGGGAGPAPAARPAAVGNRLREVIGAGHRCLARNTFIIRP